MASALCQSSRIGTLALQHQLFAAKYFVLGLYRGTIEGQHAFRHPAR
jgi:hypothetical protein